MSFRFLKGFSGTSKDGSLKLQAYCSEVFVGRTVHNV